MKTIILNLFFACSISFLAQAQTVKLKITYYDNPVTDCDVTIKHGDAAIGSGRTNSNGEVEMNASLISKSIDVYGKKETQDGKKTWDLKGYITLDDEYFSHLKMEVYVKEIAQGSGMPESMIASAWGLALSGPNTASNNNNTAANNTSNTSNAGNDNKANDDDDKVDFASMQGDALATQKTGYENEISVLDNKIKKSEKTISKLKSENADSTEIQKEENDLKTLQLRREKKQMNLDRINAKIAGGDLSKEQIQSNNDRKDEIDAELKVLKDGSKEVKKEEKAAKKDDNKAALEKQLMELKVKLGSLTVKHKVAAKAKKDGIQKEMDETKAEIETISEKLKALKN